MMSKRVHRGWDAETRARTIATIQQVQFTHFLIESIQYLNQQMTVLNEELAEVKQLIEEDCEVYEDVPAPDKQAIEDQLRQDPIIPNTLGEPDDSDYDDSWRVV